MPNFLIASDLHGSAKYTRALLDAFAREGADRLVLLGDKLGGKLFGTSLKVEGYVENEDFEVEALSMKSMIIEILFWS